MSLCYNQRLKWCSNIICMLFWIFHHPIWWKILSSTWTDLFHLGPVPMLPNALWECYKQLCQNTFVFILGYIPKYSVWSVTRRISSPCQMMSTSTLTQIFSLHTIRPDGEQMSAKCSTLDSILLCVAVACIVCSLDPDTFTLSGQTRLSRHLSVIMFHCMYLFYFCSLLTHKKVSEQQIPMGTNHFISLDPQVNINWY